MAEGPSIEYFPPSEPHAESRTATLDRVIHADHLDERPEPIDGDSTTLSGGNARIAKRVALAATAAAVVGAVVGWIIAVAPGPFHDSSALGIAGHTIIMALALAVITTLVTTLMLLEREDGRSAREEESFAHVHPGDVTEQP